MSRVGICREIDLDPLFDYQQAPYIVPNSSIYIRPAAEAEARIASRLNGGINQLTNRVGGNVYQSRHQQISLNADWMIGSHAVCSYFGFVGVTRERAIRY
jgi:hypothetical protein